ncbi:MAG TPA: sigma-54 dependent transcriptional regulator [Terrimicrobiaceae bacterium]
MSTRSATILLVEDDASISAALEQVLGDEGHEVIVAADGVTGRDLAMTRRCDLVIADFKLPGMSGLELLKELQKGRPHLPVILITAYGRSEIAIEATKLGAYDYLLKPFDMPELIALVDKALASSRLMLEPVEMGEAVSACDALIGNSRPMQEIYKEIGRIASKPVTILIRGETGTGKELVARAIYNHGDRAEKPFIAVNCAAIPETLLESELFGHEKGAFTGAATLRIGRLEQARGGTVFLDEIGDLTPSTQVKLLRVLQENAVQRVGGRAVIPVDARVIAATHRDLESAMQAGQFREDLYYRLNVITLSLPPLRDRAEDISDLVNYFLQRYGLDFGVTNPAIQPEAMELLAAQQWPGNVRELENVVRKALLISRGYPISLEDVRRSLGGSVKREQDSSVLSDYVAELLAAASTGEQQNVHAALIEAAEQELVSQAIKLAHGNQARAARWLGISRLTMREKLQRFGLHPAQESGQEHR